eukprot:scaffold2655_cov400-Prasinococcus_capsulatus_cf.AAC.9
MRAHSQRPASGAAERMRAWPRRGMHTRQSSASSPPRAAAAPCAEEAEAEAEAQLARLRLPCLLSSSRTDHPIPYLPHLAGHPSLARASDGGSPLTPCGATPSSASSPALVPPHTHILPLRQARQLAGPRAPPPQQRARRRWPAQPPRLLLRSLATVEKAGQRVWRRFISIVLRGGPPLLARAPSLRTATGLPWPQLSRGTAHLGCSRQTPTAPRNLAMAPPATASKKSVRPWTLTLVAPAADRPQ